LASETLAGWNFPSVLMVVLHDPREIADASAARRDSLYLAGTVLGPKGLQREHAARQAIGLPSRFLNSDALHHQFGIARAAALIGPARSAAGPTSMLTSMSFRSTRKRSDVFACG
jgi:hypothetical protein